MGMSKSKADQGRRQGLSTASKVALVVIGASFLVGTATVIGLDQIVKRVFVNDEWPDEEWSSDDWADEELDL